MGDRLQSERRLCRAVVCSHRNFQNVCSSHIVLLGQKLAVVASFRNFADDASFMEGI